MRNVKIINWRDDFLKLFPETTKRELKYNHKWCDKCNGIGFVGDGKYINFCTACNGQGQIELCQNGCGKNKSYYSSFCKECKDKIDNENRAKRDRENYEKAKKIKYSDYEGKFLINERVMDKEEFEEYLYDLIWDEDYPTYVYGTKKEPVMNIDFHDVIERECENGYEDMESHLDYSGVDEIQTMINKWIEKQGEANYCYWESNEVVLLDDLIETLKKEMEKR